MVMYIIIFSSCVFVYNKEVSGYLERDMFILEIRNIECVSLRK